MSSSASFSCNLCNCETCKLPRNTSHPVVCTETPACLSQQRSCKNVCWNQANGEAGGGISSPCYNPQCVQLSETPLHQDKTFWKNKPQYILISLFTQCPRGVEFVCLRALFFQGVNNPILPYLELSVGGSRPGTAC